MPKPLLDKIINVVVVASCSCNAILLANWGAGEFQQQRQLNAEVVQKFKANGLACLPMKQTMFAPVMTPGPIKDFRKNYQPVIAQHGPAEGVDRFCVGTLEKYNAGYYQSADNAIVINRDFIGAALPALDRVTSVKDMRAWSVLLHEARHKLQEAQGYTTLAPAIREATGSRQAERVALILNEADASIAAAEQLHQATVEQGRPQPYLDAIKSNDAYSGVMQAYHAGRPNGVQAARYHALIAWMNIDRTVMQAYLGKSINADPRPVTPELRRTLAAFLHQQGAQPKTLQQVSDYLDALSAQPKAPAAQAKAPVRTQPSV